MSTDGGEAPASSAPPPPARPPATAQPPPPPPSVPPPKQPLVGAVGQEYVAAVLSSTDPRSALREVADAGGLADGARCGPLLGLLDALGTSRADAHRSVLAGASARLLARIAGAPPELLAALLHASFPYIGLPALRAIPLAVLDRLRPVPPAFLARLASDRDLFADLPPGVQRQVWELDRDLLAAHAAPLVAAYAGETGTLLRALDAGEWVASAAATAAAAAGGAPGPRPPRAPRRLQRAQSPALKKLVAMVGRSPAVYRGVADLIAARVRDAPGLVTGPRTAGAAALRSQLLMALHDAGGAAATDLAASDPVHKLAWTLDACGRDGTLDDRREREVAAWLAPFERAPPPPPPPAAGPPPGRRGGGGGRKRNRGDGGGGGGDAESAGVPGLGGGRMPGGAAGGRAGAGWGGRARALCDAALVLRDPSTLRLLAHEALARLAACVDGEVPPASDGRLAFLTRLLQLGAGVRARLRDAAAGGKAAARAGVLPPADPDLMRTLYPTVAGWILEGLLADEGDDGGDAGAAPGRATPGPGAPPQPRPPGPAVPPPDAGFVALLARDEVARLVTQAHCLARLGAGDAAGAAPALAALAGALAAGSEGSAPEWAPFAAALAKGLAAWAGPPWRPGLAPGAPLWAFAVDRLLVPCVGTEPQVHEEVLRLARAAAPALGPARLASLLSSTLEASRAARRRAARGRRPPGGPAGTAGGGGASSGGTVGAPPRSRPGSASEGGGGGGGATMTSMMTGGGGSASAGRPGGGGAASRGDGVRFLYAELARTPGLGPESAPELHAYLNAG